MLPLFFPLSPLSFPRPPPIQPDQLGELARDASANMAALLTAAHNLNPGYIDMDELCKQTSDSAAKLSDPKQVVNASKEVAKNASALVACAKVYAEMNPDGNGGACKDLLTVRAGGGA